MSVIFWHLLLSKCVFGIFLDVAYCKYVEGHLSTAEEYTVQNLLLYYDSEYQWASVYKKSKTCSEKEAVLSIDQNQIINLTEYDPTSGCIRTGTFKLNSRSIIANGTDKRKDKSVNVSCHNIRRFHSVRPRWWFLAVSNCNSSNGLNLRYKFLMTNGVRGDLWREHFSADEFYILPLLALFFVIYILMLMAVIACSIELKSRQLLHSTYKLFNISVILQEIGIVLLIVSYVRYGLDGIGFIELKTIGRMFESASEILFLLLLLLLAKGYTVTRGKLKLSSSVKLTIFMCCYVATTLALFFYENMLFDPGEVLYLYESPAGYGLIILRIIAWCIFICSILFTLKHCPDKSNFYYPFNLIGTLWFIAGPCFILTANNFIDKWIRESAVYAVQHSIAVTGHLLFLLLTLPNRANKNFPYHVRTSQIGVMELNGVNVNEDDDDAHQFDRHIYAPTHNQRHASACRQPTNSDLTINPTAILFRANRPEQQNVAKFVNVEYPPDDRSLIGTDGNAIKSDGTLATNNDDAIQSDEHNVKLPSGGDQDISTEAALDHFLASSAKNK